MNTRRLSINSDGTAAVKTKSLTVAAPRASLLTLVNQARAKRGAKPIVQKTLVRYLNGYENGVPPSLLEDLKSVI